MAAWIKTVYLLVFIGILLLCFIVDSGVNARRGGGGGRRGGGSRIRTSGSSRSTSFSRTATKGAILAGVYYGSRSYMLRRRYRQGYYEPTICENTKDRINGTVYGRFICPMASQPDDQSYCCGDDEDEECCGYWDSPGRVVGAVIGILIGVAAVIICIVVFCWCCKRYYKSQKSQTTVEYTADPKQDYPAMTHYPPGSTDGQYPGYGNGSTPAYVTYPSNSTTQPGMPLDQKAYPTVQ